MEPEFPPNSDVSKREQEKDIQQVTKGEVHRKKKSLRRRFTESFVAGDAKSAVTYGILEVLLPNARDNVIDVIEATVEKLLRGDSYRRRGSVPPQSGPTGYVNYTRYSGPMGGSSYSSPQRALSRQQRAQHDFDGIVLDSRVEAEEVIDRLFDLVSRYESASVADLYALVGLASNHTDYKWGWTDLRGAGVSRSRDGYLLDLPEPTPIG